MSTIRTEIAGISTARQSLDNVLSAKANLEKTHHSIDKHCALEFQIAELEGMLAEIMDERFARTVDESPRNDENRNVGLLNFIIDTADNILASLSPASTSPPPTYQKNHINIQSHARKPNAESRDSSFPLPLDQRKRRSTNAVFPSPRSVPPKSTRLVGSPKPLSLSNPFRKANQDSSIDNLSLSAFQALKKSDPFKTLLRHTESKQIGEIDRDNLWSSFRENLDNNLSKELFCAFDLLVRVSSAERSSKDTINSRRMNPEEPTSRFINKGKAPMRSVPPVSESPSSPSPSSPSESIDSDFVTIESPGDIPSSQPKPTTTSSQPPPYSPHLTTTTPTTPTTKPSPTSCINCSLTLTHPQTTTLKVHSCGHIFCSSCAASLIKEYITRDDDDDDGLGPPLRCRCDERLRMVDGEMFIEGYYVDDGVERGRVMGLFRDRFVEGEGGVSLRYPV